ncbi:hypothetical protein LCGC14_0813000 [marine sediment metagenome]|uniref:Uncharacterized protein n=1 Tax=marine sediment metagenome TaxID=412755 RepID=A0A0F9PL59_9ZZZZ
MFNKKKLGELEELTQKLESRISDLERENRVYINTDEDLAFYADFGMGPEIETISLRSLVHMIVNFEGLKLRPGSGAAVLVKKGKPS